MAVIGDSKIKFRTGYSVINHVKEADMTDAVHDFSTPITHETNLKNKTQ